MAVQVRARENGVTQEELIETITQLVKRSYRDRRSQGSLRAEMTPKGRRRSAFIGYRLLEEARKTNTCPGLEKECCKENHGSRTTRL